MLEVLRLRLQLVDELRSLQTLLNVWLADGAAARFEAEHLELAMVHLVAWVHEEWLARICLQFGAAIVVLLSEVEPVHFCSIVILKPLHLVQKSQVADF